MKTFCSSCGAKVTSGDRFCGECGNSVTQNCPTCGQVWDGEFKGEAISEIPSSKSIKEDKKRVLKESEPESLEPKVVLSTQRLTSAWVDPIYGGAFEAKNDCANCGAKGERRGPCQTCGHSS